MARQILALAALLLLAGCNISYPHDPRAVFEDDEVYRVFDEVVDVIEARDIEALITRLHPEGRGNPDVRDQMGEAFGYLPAGDQLQATPYYAELRNGGPGFEEIPVHLMMFDVVGESGFANLMVAVAPEQGECCVVTYLDVRVMERRPSDLLDFTLEGRGPLHYVFFVLLFAVPAFCLVTAIACVLKKGVKRKWLWVPFILIGVWGVEFNWTTGGIGTDLLRVGPQGVYFQLIRFKLLGAGYLKSGVLAPWIVSIGLPLGAILYWVFPARRRPQPAARDRAADPTAA